MPAASPDSKRTGVFAGSFDPLHYGHLDLIERGMVLFDELIVGVLNNEAKRPMFDVDERVEMLSTALAQWPGCRVESFSGLLVDFARQQGAIALLRGLRSGSDLDYELPMSFMNRRMHAELETVFLLPTPGVADLASSLIKEIARMGGSVEGMVPQAVARRLEEKAASL